MAIRANDGSSLVEVLVATLVLVTGVLGVAQLFLLAAATNVAARDTTITATLAAQKIEQLLATDADVATFVDHVNMWGQVVGTSESPPANAVYTRRWSIEPLSLETQAIRVRVGRSDRTGGPGAMAGETRVLAVKPRPRS